MGAGVTTNGNAWTTYSAVVSGAGTVRWGVGDTHLGDTDIPVLLYAHGAGGSSNQFEGFSSWLGLREWLIDNGWAWIEGSGGGSQPWGNTASRVAYENAYTHVAGVLDLGSVVPLGRSMGGLVVQWLYTQSAVLAPVSVGLIVNSGVQSLAAAYASGNWTTEIRAAYGAADDATFNAASIGYDPLLFSASEWAGLNVLQLVGTADTTVPPADHGYAMRTHYAGQPSIDSLYERIGGDHSTGNGLYTATAPMTEFLAQVTGQAPEERFFYRVSGRYLVGEDLGRYPILGTLKAVAP